MRALYIGHYEPGSTSRMRGEYLKQLLPAHNFVVANIDVPIRNTPRPLRSIGWRFRKGPLIKNINRYITSILDNNFSYDLVWVDKGVFVDPSTIHKLRSGSRLLVHFTPDPAFTYHRSQLFYDAIDQYDYCVTTKSYELGHYEQHGVKTIFCTQGYDPAVHKPYHSLQEKDGVVFIGHKEEEREYIISMLVEKNIRITVAGNHWDTFAKKRKHRLNLIYKGKGIFGHEYAGELSKAMVGLGLLSRWVPELHTTRTFEIPACKTALVTERNHEIGSIYSDDEVIFFSDPHEAVSRVEELIGNKERLFAVCVNGYQKVLQGGYSYPEILKKILAKVNG